MTTALKIDFVSDVSCPWCVIGLKSLDQALEREDFYPSQGIHSVPALIINDRHLISGGQPAEVFEQTLRQLAAASPRHAASNAC